MSYNKLKQIDFATNLQSLLLNLIRVHPVKCWYLIFSSAFRRELITIYFTLTCIVN